MYCTSLLHLMPSLTFDSLSSPPSLPATAFSFLLSLSTNTTALTYLGLPRLGAGISCSCFVFTHSWDRWREEIGWWGGDRRNVFVVFTSTCPLCCHCGCKAMYIMQLLKCFWINENTWGYFWSFFFDFTSKQFHAGQEFTEEIVVSQCSA